MMSQNVICFVFQKQEKYSVNKLKALHARNEYLINIEVANAAINKYFSDDVSDLMDVSFNNMICDARKPVFGVSDLDRHKPACTSTEAR